MPRPRRDGSTPAAPRKLKFTDGLIGKLKPQPKPYAIWDLRQPGLAVLVQPSGHRAFKFVYSFRSRPRWYHIGNAVIPVADARRLAVGVMLQVIEGKDPAAEKKAERTNTGRVTVTPPATCASKMSVPCGSGAALSAAITMRPTTRAHFQQEAFVESNHD